MQRRLNESTEKYQKVKKLLWIYRLCQSFKNERFEWECPKKCPTGISQGRPKASDLAESVRKNKITKNFTKKEKVDYVLQKLVFGDCADLYPPQKKVARV